MTKVTEMVQLSDEQKKRQRKRSIAIAVSLGVLVAIFYAITLVKMGPGILNRPL
ncbi:hypothetical protein [Cohaesibacter gelatinilyticus]|uniref:CoxF protein n=1 Tax=Cohaesibacter gelatinilyticus TaxID=372072 RepID=A0A285N7Q8_9HYPH|nr:hypothetical protein [Cohaesibacter gelatinilyticus]SNZ05459.1 hypothetical protein SAMN06265368_0124 [Cohaesibacter gelatinilyticus]